MLLVKSMIDTGCVACHRLAGGSSDHLVVMCGLADL